MRNVLAQALQIRKTFYHILKHTPREELLEIPAGFNNNIWWNIAHILVTQQILVYKLSGLQMRVPQELVDKFMKGTVPDGTTTDAEIKMVSAFLFSTLEWTQEDYEAGLFKEYDEYTTSNNVTLRSVDDAIAFNVFHEGLHLGVILSLQKALLSQA